MKNKKGFSLQEIRDTPNDVDLIERFGEHAEFQGVYHRLTLFGWAVLHDYRLARRLIRDVDVNAWCRKSVLAEDEGDTPIDLIVLGSFDPTLDRHKDMLRLLVVNGADLKNVRAATLECNKCVLGVDLLGDAQAYAKDFRAKLCAIFWVTQRIAVWRDMGEPLVERVFMSSLSE